jgi:hypothetical protein
MYTVMPFHTSIVSLSVRNFFHCWGAMMMPGRRNVFSKCRNLAGRRWSVPLMTSAILPGDDGQHCDIDRTPEEVSHILYVLQVMVMCFVMQCTRTGDARSEREVANKGAFVLFTYRSGAKY